MDKTKCPNWEALFRSILELACDVKEKLDARKNPNEWELSENRREADELIKTFWLHNHKWIIQKDPSLFNDLLRVFDIREFAYQDSLRDLRDERVKKELPTLPATPVKQLASHLDDIRKRVDKLLDDLLPYNKNIDAGLFPDLGPHLNDLSEYRQAAEDLREEIKSLAYLRTLHDQYENAFHYAVLAHNEAAWLEHIARKERKCAAES